MIRDSKKQLSWAIIGGGNGGQSLAGHLGLMGFPVKIYDIFPKTIDAIQAQGGIHVKGEAEGFGSVELATTDIAEAIHGADLVMIVAPAVAHCEIAKNCAPWLDDGQVVFIHPGATGGALEFWNVLQNHGCQRDLVVGESNSLIYACRSPKPGYATIFGIKKELMAWRREGPLDTGGTIAALIFQSAPPFVTGLLLLMVLSYRLDLFPTGGMYTPGSALAKGLALVFSTDFLHHLVLPTITVSLFYLATPMLIMRDSMLEVMGSDFIELAKAKGLAPHVVMIKHAARNALLAVVTVASLMIGFAIGGQVLVETVFSWPGMGKLMVEAAQSHDYPVAQATFLVLASLVIFLNLLSDLSYCYLDPRIKLGQTKGA